jgi:hypothetical protein
MAKHEHSDLGRDQGDAAVQASAAARSSDAATGAAQGERIRGRRDAAVPAGVGPGPCAQSAAEADAAARPANGRSGLQAAAGAAAEARQMTEEARCAFEHLLRQQRAYAYDRAGHLTRLSQCVALAGLVAGGAIFTELSATGVGKYILGVIIPIIAAAEVVFGFAKRAERWREIVRETDDMLTRLDAMTEAAASDLIAMRFDYDAIVIPNEPLFHWARAIAMNVANREMDYAKREPVNDWRAFFRNIWPGRPDY